MAITIAAILVLFDRTVSTAIMIPVRIEITRVTSSAERCVSIVRQRPHGRWICRSGSCVVVVATVTRWVSAVVARVVTGTAGVIVGGGIWAVVKIVHWQPARCVVAAVAFLCAGTDMPLILSGSYAVGTVA
jgi:hypothetical protein